MQKFAFVKLYNYTKPYNIFYHCKATILIYTCVLAGDTHVNSSVENAFI